MNAAWSARRSVRSATLAAIEATVVTTTPCLTELDESQAQDHFSERAVVRGLRRIFLNPEHRSDGVRSCPRSSSSRARRHERRWEAVMIKTSGKDAMEPGFALSDIDTTTPHPARMYNAYLGGYFL